MSQKSSVTYLRFLSQLGIKLKYLLMYLCLMYMTKEKLEKLEESQHPCLCQ